MRTRKETGQQEEETRGEKEWMGEETKEGKEWMVGVVGGMVAWEGAREGEV